MSASVSACNNPVYTIQPVVKPAVKPVWQPVGQQVVSCIQTSNRLSNRLYNRLFNCTAGWTTGQPAALCKQTSNRLSYRLYNRSDNRLYRVNGVLNRRSITMRNVLFLNSPITVSQSLYWEDVQTLGRDVSDLPKPIITAWNELNQHTIDIAVKQRPVSLCRRSGWTFRA